MSQNLYLIANGTTKAFPIHFTSNPDFGSPHNRKKYPDKRRIFPMYLNTSVFDIKGVSPDQCCYSPSVTIFQSIVKLVKSGTYLTVHA